MTMDKDKFLEPAPEVKLQHPIAPWRDGSYEHLHGTAYPDLAEETPAVKRLREKFPQDVLAFRGYRGDACVLLRKDDIRAVLQFLRDDPGLNFDLLRDLFGMDDLKTLERQKEFADVGLPNVRFEVIYHLYSLRHRHDLRLRVGIPEVDCKIDTVSALYRCADWFEREAWDMYGIHFQGHPNQRRILNHDAFEGHPLRKDYPVNRRHNFLKPTNP